MREIHSQLNDWVDGLSREESATLAGISATVGYYVIGTLLRVGPPSPAGTAVGLGVALTIATYLFTFGDRD